LVGDDVMSDVVLRVRAKVQEWLVEEFSGVVVGTPGVSDFEFTIESTFVGIAVVPLGEGKTVIKVSAPVLYDAPVTDELKTYVLENAGSWVFGGYRYFEDEGGANVVFQHSILGDYVDKEEFMTSVIAVGATADELDDELAARFGGRRPLDPPADG
jgi:hypothetical protein